MVDGTIEYDEFNFGKFESVPTLDPLDGAVRQKVKRLSLVDGTLEETESLVILPFPKRQFNNDLGGAVE